MSRADACHLVSPRVLNSNVDATDCNRPKSKSTLLLVFAYSATSCIRRSGVIQALNQVHECLQSFAVPLRIRLIMYPQAALRFHSNQAKYQMCNCFHLYTGR